MPQWSMRMRRQMEKRLFRALQARQSEFEQDGICIDLREGEAVLRAVDSHLGRYTLKISTASVDAGFFISVISSDTSPAPPDNHIIRDPSAVLAFLNRRLDQLHGHDPDAEVILSRIETWASSREAAEDWYRYTPIPALGGNTAQQQVAKGGVNDVLAYLDHLGQGGYA